MGVERQRRVQVAFGGRNDDVAKGSGRVTWKMKSRSHGLMAHQSPS